MKHSYIFLVVCFDDIEDNDHVFGLNLNVSSM